MSVTHFPEVAAASGSPAATSGVLVLLCGSLRKLGNGLDLDAIAWWLEDATPGTRVVIVADLCNKPKSIADAPINHPGAVVLGLCSNDYSETEFQRSVRRVGIDPLAVTVVNLGSYCARPLKIRRATAKAKALTAAAVARVRAFPGSRPGDIRPYIIGDDQKISRRALFTMPPIGYRPVASIDNSKCTADRGCQECVQVCPTDALTSVAGRIEVARRSCEACGICESACPTSAVSLAGRSLQQIEAEIRELLSIPARDETETRGILFVCQRSARKIDSLADHWFPVTVPCTGSVSPAMLLQSLACGASSAAVLGCTEDCEFRQQEKVSEKVDYCREVLSSLGRSPEAIRFFDADGTPSDLADALSNALPASCTVRSDEAASISFSGPEATARALIALAGDDDPDRTFDIIHPSSPLGVVTVDASDCTGCGSCAQFCPTAALDLTERDGTVALSFDPALCTACSQCVSVCPENVVHAARSTDMRRLRGGRITLYEDDTIRCESCGESVGPATMLRRIEALMSAGEQRPSDSTKSAIRRFCPACRAVSGRVR